MDGGLLAELQRQITRSLTIGVVTEVSEQKVRVQIGKNFTPFIPFIALRAGKIKIYCPPSVGEQVFVFSLSGSYENAIAGPSLFCNTFPEPSHGKELYIDAYGTMIRVDAEGITINATKSTITGDISIQGDVDVNGKITASDVISSNADVHIESVSLKNHKHSGITSGTELTTAPVS